jgi:hypothetical protein
MGRTLPPFRPALEHEIEQWKDFERGLRAADKPIFQTMMNHARTHADAGSLVIKGLVSEIILMSICFEHEKMIADLKTKIEVLEATISDLKEIQSTEHAKK